MDDKNLDKILSEMDIPEADKNAQKRAVNLAMDEFSKNNKENEKKSQGFLLLSRLMTRTNKNNRRDQMERKTRNRFAYGGLVTAAILIAVTGTAYLGQNDSTVQVIGAVEKDANFSSVAGNVTSSVDKLAMVKDAKKNVEKSREVAEAEVAADSFGDFSVAQNNIAATPMAAPMPMATAKMSRKAAGMSVTQSMIAPQPYPIVVDDISPNYYQDVGQDKFEDINTNPFKQVSDAPVSTFSTDVDTASYSFVRRQLNNNVLPQKDAVRIEEMVNYFDYNYPLPETREQPFKPTATIIDSPWSAGKKLMHIGIKGFDVIDNERPKANLVFLLDVSGSMNNPNKLPLLVSSLKMLVDTLNEDDKVSIVVYAGAAGAVLEPTSATDKTKIHNALDKLRAGGGTAGAAGINLAYQLAEENFDENAVNRVILATDGDFNVGITNREELKDFVERKRESGIFLSVFGFGQGNYNDHMMQTLAQNGNGVAAYIDTLSEARKVLVEEATSSLFPIAKDVKIQLEFNPKVVSEYRLVGYETRALKREDFNNDKVDAGDIGAGHTVTAIYEITPVGSKNQSMDPLRYSDEEKQTEVKSDVVDEYAFVKVRYKLPKEDTSKLLTTSVTVKDELGEVTDLVKENDKVLHNDIAFSIAVAGFAQKLKGGKYTGELSYDDIIMLANSAKGDDPYGYRAEFVQLVRMAKTANEM